LLATKLFNKPPVAILNGTSNPIGLHNEHSLFQRISIHLHFDVKASKHLASLLTTDWQRERQALDYLFILSFRVANFLFANSQNTQPHFITGMTCKCIVLLFFLKTIIFRGYPRVGRAVEHNANPCHQVFVHISSTLSLAHIWSRRWVWLIRKRDSR
jgi:hypothetical protein